ncbi:MAG: hypothetical protein Q9217_000811 [Psora testacea]
MSYLDNQLSAFKSSVSSSSGKIANKRTVAALPSNTATSPRSSQGTKADTKRKRPEQDLVYSQPADNGTGRNVMTQITYAIEYLKSKGTPQTLTDLLSYLSLQHRENDYKRTIGTILMNHDKVEYERKSDGGEGTFRFRPVHNIRSKNTLIGHLQSQPTAQGLSVRELRDGWPGAEAAIDELEGEGKLLVTRNKKDNHAKMVWANDPSLSYKIDDEFQTIWQRIRLPEPRALADELENAGLMPANKTRNVEKPIKQDVKKTKKPRKGGKTTNTHMAGVLRDYSHLKR